MSLEPLTLALFLACFVRSAASSASPLNCRELSIPVAVSAENKDLPPTLEISSFNNTGALNDLVAGLSSSLVQGNFSIAARFCEPLTSNPERHDTLQILVHGILENRNYWSGLAPPGTKAGQNRYSWIRYAAEQGHPTLSVDRLCNGNSSKPNGIIFCQLPLEAEVMHAIIQIARDGQIPGAGRAFQRIIYVGHSYGSLVGNGLSAQHPSDVDAFLLTGFSANLTQGEAGAAILPGFRPASLVSPTRYADVLLDPSYVTATSLSGTRTLVYYGDYDPAILQYDDDHRGTITIGEIATVQLGQIPAPNFRDSVFVVDGNEDGIFCEANATTSVTGTPGNCSNGFASGVHSYYPAASQFEFHITAETGHNLNLHRTANNRFELLMNF